MLLAQACWRERSVKFVGFLCTLCKQIIKVREGAERLFAFCNLLQSEPDRPAFLRRDVNLIDSCGLRSDAGRINGIRYRPALRNY